MFDRGIVMQFRSSGCSRGMVPPKTVAIIAGSLLLVVVTVSNKAITMDERLHIINRPNSEKPEV